MQKNKGRRIFSALALALAAALCGCFAPVSLGASVLSTAPPAQPVPIVGQQAESEPQQALSAEIDISRLESFKANRKAMVVLTASYVEGQGWAFSPAYDVYPANDTSARIGWYALLAVAVLSLVVNLILIIFTAGKAGRAGSGDYNQDYGGYTDSAGYGAQDYQQEQPKKAGLLGFQKKSKKKREDDQGGFY